MKSYEVQGFLIPELHRQMGNLDPNHPVFQLFESRLEVLFPRRQLKDYTCNGPSSFPQKLSSHVLRLTLNKVKAIWKDHYREGIQRAL